LARQRAVPLIYFFGLLRCEACGQYDSFHLTGSEVPPRGQDPPDAFWTQVSCRACGASTQDWSGVLMHELPERRHHSRPRGHA
jgi:hypothetical protein